MPDNLHHLHNMEANPVALNFIEWPIQLVSNEGHHAWISPCVHVCTVSLCQRLSCTNVTACGGPGQDEVGSPPVLQSQEPNPMFLFLIYFLLCYHLVGQVAKVSASNRTSGVWVPFAPWDFSRSSHTSDLQTDTPVATLPGTWCYWVSAGTGWPGVSILWLGEVESWICNFYLSVAARTLVWTDPPLRYTSCWDIKQPASSFASLPSCLFPQPFILHSPFTCIFSITLFNQYHNPKIVFNAQPTGMVIQPKGKLGLPVWRLTEKSQSNETKSSSWNEERRKGTFINATGNVEICVVDL